MPAFTTATLDYLVNSYGATAAQLINMIVSTALPLPAGLFAKASVSVTSDLAAVVGAQARRRLVLALGQPQLQTRRPTKLIPGLVTPVSFGLQLYSSSAKDTAGGVGARTVQVGYTDAAGVPHTDTFVLNGKTPVFGGGGGGGYAAITQTNTQILTAGSLGANAGTIYMRAVPNAGPQNLTQSGIVGCIPDSFYVRFPDGTDQKSPFQGLLTQLLSQAVGRVVTQDVVLS